MKKGISGMWLIIVAAVVALVVGIVIMVIFTSKSSAISGGLLDCESKGGVCSIDYQGKEGPNQCREDGGSPSKTFKCAGEPDWTCCFIEKNEPQQEGGS